MIQVFINEVSVHAQFNSIDEFAGAIKQFISVLEPLDVDCVRKTTRVFASAMLDGKQATPHANFVGGINRIRDVSIKTRYFTILTNHFGLTRWEYEQLHDGNVLFSHQGVSCSQTSLAESAERQLQSNDMDFIVLVNFTGSKFSSACTIPIVKQSVSSTIAVACFEEAIAISGWLNRTLGRNVREYTSSCDHPPLDKQTALSNETRFEPTHYRVLGAKVYRELGTGRFWHVDTLHYGQAAHLEVYNSNGEHIGEATVDGLALNVDARDATKTMEL